RIELGEVLLVGLLVPLEEIRLVDEIAGDDVVDAVHILGKLVDFFQRSNGGADDVKERQLELSGTGRFERADAIESVECDREIARLEIDKSDPNAGRVECIEDLHLIRDIVEIDDFGDGGVEALQRSARM